MIPYEVYTEYAEKVGSIEGVKENGKTVAGSKKKGGERLYKLSAARAAQKMFLFSTAYSSSAASVEYIRSEINKLSLSKKDKVALYNTFYPPK